MFLCCCPSKVNQEQPENGDPDLEENKQESWSGSLNKMLYNRIGRVEKFKHGSTILFLGKAVSVAILIILLVQVIANTEVCYLDAELSQLPQDVQKILLDNNQMNSYRCPYNDKLDVAYTFDLVILSENDTSAANVTAIKVKIADILPKKIHTEQYPGIASDHYQVETATQLCGKMCSVRSCKCFSKVIFSPACYVDNYEYGLQIDELAHDEHQHGMFSIYFVVCAFIIIFGVLFYTIYKIVYSLCGGKRTSVANIG